VDAGVHLAAISKILDPYIAEAQAKSSDLPITITSGPFAGLDLPHRTSHANAAHITRTVIETYLITHPHLDHISGFVVNTAALPGTRPKRLAGLPSTINAFKTHIFNNVIWPNLSDENNGAGLVTYTRLVEGGSPYIGDGDGKGYVEVCDGLSVKTWAVTHGHCLEHNPHRGSGTEFRPRNARDSITQFDASPTRSNSSMVGGTFRRDISPPRYEISERICVYDSSAYFIRDIATGNEVLIFGDVEPDTISPFPRNARVWADAAPKIISKSLKGILIECSYDDSQKDDSLFGHLCPRHLIQELRVLAGAVNDMRAPLDDDRGRDNKKRKRPSNGVFSDTEVGSRRHSSRFSSPTAPTSHPSLPEVRRVGSGGASAVSPRTQPTSLGPLQMDVYDSDGNLDIPAPLYPRTTPKTANLLPSERMVSVPWPSTSSALTPTTTNMHLSESTKGHAMLKPLAGVKIVIIHVKDKLNDATPVGDNILRQMQEYEREEQLGCEFIISEVGMSIFL
jgi:cAMP phosphodiesterase